MVQGEFVSMWALCRIFTMFLKLSHVSVWNILKFCSQLRLRDKAFLNWVTSQYGTFWIFFLSLGCVIRLWAKFWHRSWYWVVSRSGAWKILLLAKRYFVLFWGASLGLGVEQCVPLQKWWVCSSWIFVFSFVDLRCHHVLGGALGESQATWWDFGCGRKTVEHDKHSWEPELVLRGNDQSRHCGIWDNNQKASFIFWGKGFRTWCCWLRHVANVCLLCRRQYTP